MKMYKLSFGIFIGVFIFCIGIPVFAADPLNNSQNTTSAPKTSTSNYHCPPLSTEKGETVNGYTFYTDYQEYIKIFQDESDENTALNAVKKIYHARINTRFNEEIEKMKSLTEEAYKEENLAKKSESSKKETDATVLTRELTQRLREYQCVLFQHRNNPQTSGTGKLMFEAMGELLSIEKTFDAEMYHSERALIISLRMYSQMRMYYAIHLKLQLVIQSLTKEKDALRDFVGIVLNLPAKFINSGSKDPLQ
ncbi:MAG: hypothetical protein WCJ84_06035 [Candidatus Peregrinibacteria bacterium]